MRGFGTLLFWANIPRVVQTEHGNRGPGSRLFVDLPFELDLDVLRSFFGALEDLNLRGLIGRFAIIPNLSRAGEERIFERHKMVCMGAESCEGPGRVVDVLV